MIAKRFQYFIWAVFTLICAFVISAVPAFSQGGSQGTIVITAVDSTGALIPGANLQLVETSTNSTRSAKTESKGGYTFVELPIGTYSLRVSKDGYSTQLFQSIVVESAHTTTVTAKLSKMQVPSVVDATVSSNPVLETSSNQIGTVVDMKQIEDLPLSVSTYPSSAIWLDQD